MSVKLMAKAWEMAIPQGQKIVLLALCDHSNDDGTCYPSQWKLASKCSATEKSISRHINWLKSHGILKTERRQIGRKRLSDFYIISLENYTVNEMKEEPDNLEGSNLEGSKKVPHEPDNLSGYFKEEPSIEPSLKNNKKEKAHVCNKNIAEEIKNNFNKILPKMEIRILNDNRIKAIRSRWDELASAYEIDKTNATEMVEAFSNLFSYIEESDFLTGRNGCWMNCGFDWIFKQANFIKILEGNYENKEQSV